LKIDGMNRIFLGYRVYHHGYFDVYLGSVDGITDADLAAIVDFANKTEPEMETIFVYVPDEEDASLIYHRSVNRWELKNLVQE
jgi:hypothetical protein